MSAIKAGEAFIQASLRGGDTVRRKLGELSGRLTKLAKVGAGALATGLGVAGGTLAAIALKAAKAGDEIDKMSQRTGASSEFLSQMGFAMEQSGGSIQDLEKGLFGLSRAYFDAGNGSQTAIDGFAALGISMAQLDGLTPEAQMRLVADGMKDVEDASTRGAVAQKLFGRAGRQMLPLLTTGADGMAAFAAESDNLGRTMSGDQTAAAAEFMDTLNRVSSVVKGLVFDLGASLLPVFESLLTDVQAAINAFGPATDSIEGMSDAGGGLGDVLAMLGSPIEFLVKSGAAIAGVFRSVQSAISFAASSLAKFVQLAAKAGEHIPGLGEFSKSAGDLAGFIAEDLERLSKEQAGQAHENFDLAFSNEISERMARERAKLKKTTEELPPMPIFNGDDIAEPEVKQIAKVKEAVAKEASGPNLKTVGSFSGLAVERLASVQKTQADKTNVLLKDSLRWLRKIAENHFEFI